MGGATYRTGAIGSVPYPTITLHSMLHGACLDPISCRANVTCCFRRLKLLVFVVTAPTPSGAILRDAIRETWATLADPEIAEVTVRFAIGRVKDEAVEKSLRAESDRHKDIHRTDSDEG